MSQETHCSGLLEKTILEENARRRLRLQEPVLAWKGGPTLADTHQQKGEKAQTNVRFLPLKFPQTTDLPGKHLKVKTELALKYLAMALGLSKHTVKGAGAPVSLVLGGPQHAADFRLPVADVSTEVSDEYVTEPDLFHGFRIQEEARPTV